MRPNLGSHVAVWLNAVWLTSFVTADGAGPLAVFIMCFGYGFFTGWALNRFGLLYR